MNSHSPHHETKGQSSRHCEQVVSVGLQWPWARELSPFEVRALGGIAVFGVTMQLPMEWRPLGCTCTLLVAARALFVAAAEIDGTDVSAGAGLFRLLGLHVLAENLEGLRRRHGATKPRAWHRAGMKKSASPTASAA